MDWQSYHWCMLLAGQAFPGIQADFGGISILLIPSDYMLSPRDHDEGIMITTYECHNIELLQLLLASLLTAESCTPTSVRG